MNLCNEERILEIFLPDNTLQSAKLQIWEEAPDNPDYVKLVLLAESASIISIAEDFFSALCEIRRKLESDDLMLRCYGGSLNVYPSPMSRTSDKAFKLKMGCQARQSDLVCIFDSGPDIHPATLNEQEDYYQNWLLSLL